MNGVDLCDNNRPLWDRIASDRRVVECHMLGLQGENQSETPKFLDECLRVWQSRLVGGGHFLKLAIRIGKKRQKTNQF